MLQREMLRARGAQPEMFNAVLGGWKSKEPSSIKTHQQLGTVRVGTLGDHGVQNDVRLVVHIRAIFFDVTAAQRVARKSQAVSAFPAPGGSSHGIQIGSLAPRAEFSIAWPWVPGIYWVLLLSSSSATPCKSMPLEPAPKPERRGHFINA